MSKYFQIFILCICIIIQLDYINCRRYSKLQKGELSSKDILKLSEILSGRAEYDGTEFETILKQVDERRTKYIQVLHTLETSMYGSTLAPRPIPEDTDSNFEAAIAY